MDKWHSRPSPGAMQPFAQNGVVIIGEARAHVQRGTYQLGSAAALRRFCLRGFRTEIGTLSAQIVSDPMKQPASSFNDEAPAHTFLNPADGRHCPDGLKCGDYLLRQ